MTVTFLVMYVAVCRILCCFYVCASYFVQKVSDVVTARVQSDAKITYIVIKIST